MANYVGCTTNRLVRRAVRGRLKMSDQLIDHRIADVGYFTTFDSRNANGSTRSLAEAVGETRVAAVGGSQAYEPEDGSPAAASMPDALLMASA